MNVESSETHFGSTGAFAPADVDGPKPAVRSRTGGAAALGAVLCLWTACAVAQDPASPISTGSLLQVFLGLAVVLALVAGASWFVKRIGHVPGSASHAIKVIGAAAVGARERVVLIEVAGQWLVVGVAPGQVRSLATLPRGEAPAPGPQSIAGGAFNDWLRRFTERQHAK